MSWTLTQHHSTTQVAPNFSDSYQSPVTQGQLLLVIAGVADWQTMSISNTGTCGVQTWNPAFTPAAYQGNAEDAQVWWAIASGSGTCTVNVTIGGGTTNGELYLMEWSGSSVSAAMAQDSGSPQGANGSGVTNIVAPSITTHLPDVLLIGQLDSAYAQTVNSPWTKLDASPPNGDNVFYRTGLPAATYTPDAGSNAISQAQSGGFTCVLVALGIAGLTVIANSTGQTLATAGGGTATYYTAPVETTLQIAIGP